MINKKLSCPKFLGLVFLSIAAMVAADFFKSQLTFYGVPGEFLNLISLLLYGIVILGWGTAFKRKLQPGSTNLTVTFMILTGISAVVFQSALTFIPNNVPSKSYVDTLSFVPVFLLPYLSWVFMSNILKNEKTQLSKGQKTILFWPLLAIILVITDPIHGITSSTVLTGIPVSTLAAALTFYIFGLTSFSNLKKMKKQEGHTKYPGITFSLFILAGLIPLWNSFAMAFNFILLKEPILFTIGLHFIMLYSMTVTSILPIQNRDRFLLPHMQLPLMLYNSNLEAVGKSKSAPVIDDPSFNYLAEKGVAICGNWELTFKGINAGYVVEPEILQTEMRLHNEWAELCKEAKELKKMENRTFKEHAFNAVKTSETDKNLLLLKKVAGTTNHQLETIESLTASFSTKSEDEQRMALHTMDILGTFISCTAKLCTYNKECSSDTLLSFIQKSEKGLLPLKTSCETKIEKNIPLSTKDVLLCYSIFEELLEQSLRNLIAIKVSLKNQAEKITFTTSIKTLDTFVLAPFSLELSKQLKDYGNHIEVLNQPLKADNHGVTIILNFKKEV